MSAPVPQYVYKAEYIKNHDGDTVTLRLDHGKFPVSKACTEAEIRVNRLWCDEMDEPKGPAARDFVERTLRGAKSIIVQTYHGSFARTVGDVWVDGVLLTELVSDAGLGRVV